MSDLHRTVIRKARKEHRCDLCGELIIKGEHYSDTNFLHDDIFYHQKNAYRML
jgi:hypothetical protein